MDIKEQWQQTPFWQKVLLSTVLSGVVSYILYISFVEPKKNEYNQLEAEVENIEAQLQTLKASANSKTLERLERKIKELEQENNEKKMMIEKFRSSIPAQPELEKVLGLISEKSKSFGLIINSFKVDKEEDVQLYYDEKEATLKTFNKDSKDNKDKIPENLIHLKKITIQSSLNGDIKSIFPFINSISSSQRVIMIDKLEIRKESNKLGYILTFSIYYSPEEGV